MSPCVPSCILQAPLGHACSVEASRTIAEATELFKITVSFGSVTSLISLPCYMSHAAIPAEVRAARGLPDDLVRLSIGIEEPADLLAGAARPPRHSIRSLSMDAGAMQHMTGELLRRPACALLSLLERGLRHDACMPCCVVRPLESQGSTVQSEVSGLRRADLEQAMGKAMQEIGMSAEAPSTHHAEQLGATDRERRLLQRISALEQQLARK